MTEQGCVPASLDLGCFGQVTCYRYMLETVRCYRCQTFGRRQRQCQRSRDLCGVCSKDHTTRECVRHLKAGGLRSSVRCPNYGNRHHAWFRWCPAWLQRIPGAVLRPWRMSVVEAQRPAATEGPHCPIQEPPADPTPARKQRRRTGNPESSTTPGEWKWTSLIRRHQ